MKTILLIFTCFIAFQLAANTTTKNYLSENYYGLEQGANSWWLQHSDYWQFSNDVKYQGENALMFTCSDANSITETLKAFAGDDAYEGSLVNIDTGTYTLKMNVWIDANYTGSGFSAIIKEGWYKTTFSFSGLETGRWVELSKDITLSESIVNSKLLFTVSTAQAASGKFYIDNIQLLGEIEANNDVPYTSSIITEGDSRLTLAQDYYDMSMMVYVEENTTIDHFYTIIDAPYTAIKWDISKLTRNTWIELKQSFQLEEEANNANFEVKVPNNPEQGGGKGTFFIDNIALIVSEISTLEDATTLNFKLYPNPAQTLVKIETEINSQICIYNMLGKLEKQHITNSKVSEIQISDLVPGIYLVSVHSDASQAQQVLLIK